MGSCVAPEAIPPAFRSRHPFRDLLGESGQSGGPLDMARGLRDRLGTDPRAQGPVLELLGHPDHLQATLLRDALQTAPEHPGPLTVEAGLPACRVLRERSFPRESDSFRERLPSATDQGQIALFNFRSFFWGESA